MSEKNAAAVKSQIDYKNAARQAALRGKKLREAAPPPKRRRLLAPSGPPR